MRGPDFEQIDVLLADKTVVGADFDDRSGGIDAEIRHAPLISGDMIMKSSSELLPQYGFLGSHSTGNVESPESKVFLNTNVPFSAFICGVQGSGKSHTTSCILENALLPSRHLGRLENPVSALVFSYGDFSSGGVGFSISEAAFLAGPNAAFPGHSRVKKITVLTSPTNNAIRKRYERLPNVRAIPFTLDPRSLDIGNMLTLMAVNESAATPLYMAKIESILRDMARESEDSVFDYLEFKERLKLCEFMPAQSVALEQRLGVLESFLDMSGNAPQPKFRPGEVTIIDLSCPFVSANTACILFKICLQRYLQSQASGKMVVLDEAHKYMLNVPGARLLNDYLVSIIRLQRHYGARVVISTQEPTLLTDLIALCSVTVIHRFTSPEWYNALRKHISIAADDKHETLRRIETLTTGTALVYSSNAVLGKTEDGFLIKGDGRLLKLDIRKRVTSDGGQSVMSV
ncbi:hypothetical protein BDV95DRAFT_500042 [Massariosphaeria phaeospora]|uniref:AAA+ ATPase domain-containing protein n=1 Tax=Massariosphaeria phaeospora TaxID=100035 RepID=A0A7C8I6N5_9PLEO|nr:hypothetical protein BDV95DRAFT_500042 [Massariosphaeria phaeospora]